MKTKNKIRETELYMYAPSITNILPADFDAMDIIFYKIQL